MHQDYDLGEHHSRLLTMACEAWDRACQAREILAKDGIVIGGREAAVRPHPAVAIERDAHRICASGRPLRNFQWMPA